MKTASKTRVWVYQSDRSFTLKEEQSIQNILNTFVATWKAHEQALQAYTEIKYHRFIILMVDESITGASGCSIDKSIRMIQEIGNQFNVNFFDRMNIAYKTASGVESCTKEEFEKKLLTKEITENSIVYNNLVNNLQEYENNWEIPFKDSWHENFFSLPASA